MAVTMLFSFYFAAQLLAAPAVFGNPTCSNDAVGAACPRSEDETIDVSSLMQSKLSKDGDVLSHTKRRPRRVQAGQPEQAAQPGKLKEAEANQAQPDLALLEILPAIKLVGLNGKEPLRKIDVTDETTTSNDKAQPDLALLEMQGKGAKERLRKIDATEEITTSNDKDLDLEEKLATDGYSDLSEAAPDSRVIATNGNYPDASWKVYYSNLIQAYANPVATSSGESREFLLMGVISWAIWMVLAFVVVHCCYTRGFESTIAATSGLGQDPTKTFNSGHFDCFSDTWTCFASFMCIGIRWADTISQLDFLSFWSAFSLFAVLCLLNISIGGFCGFGFITACALLYYRTLLREKLQLPAWTFSTCLLDCCFVFWCPCCAVAQEARVLKEAKQKRILNFE